MYKTPSLINPIYPLKEKQVLMYDFINLIMKYNKTNNLTILKLMDIEFNFTKEQLNTLKLDENKNILIKVLGKISRDDTILAIFACKFILDNLIYINNKRIYKDFNLKYIKHLLTTCCTKIEFHKNKKEADFYNKIFCTDTQNIDVISQKIENFLTLIFGSVLSKYSNIIDLLNNNKKKIYEMWYTAKYLDQMLNK